jgi:hypothetical protein
MICNVLVMMCASQSVSCSCLVNVESRLLLLPYYSARGSYTMEDWLNFVECYSPYIFKPEHLGTELHALWELLAAATLHYCRPTPAASLDDKVNAGSTEDRIADHAMQGRSYLFKYATTLESKGFPSSMFTYNLHLLVCRFVLPIRCCDTGVVLLITN